MQRVYAKNPIHAIELTRIFILFGVDFNVRGEPFTNDAGNVMSDKTCIHFLMMISSWNDCKWTPEDKEKIFGMILDSGRVNVHLKDSNGNDALKLAVLHRLPLQVVKLITGKAIETDPGDLFTSRNRHGNTVLEDAVTTTEDVNKLLYEVCTCLSPNNPIPLPKPLINEFEEYALTYPAHFDSIRQMMKRLSNVNQLYFEKPFFHESMFSLISLMSLGAKAPSATNNVTLNAQLALIKRFIELGIDFDRQDNMQRTCLVFVIQHADYFPKSANPLYQPRKTLYNIIKLMLRHGANPSIEDKDGHDALKHAIMKAFPRDTLICRTKSI